MPTAVNSNVTFEHDIDDKSDEPGDSRDGETVTICVSVVLVLIILVLSALLAYREVTRRRKLSEFLEDRARRASIRRAVRLKLQQLQLLEDSSSCMEQKEAKVTVVTFGDVIMISPAQSPVPSPILQDRRIFAKQNLRHYEELQEKCQQQIHQVPDRRNYRRLSCYQQSQNDDLHYRMRDHYSQECSLQDLIPQNHRHFYIQETAAYKDEGLSVENVDKFPKKAAKSSQNSTSSHTDKQSNVSNNPMLSSNVQFQCSEIFPGIVRSENKREQCPPFVSGSMDTI